MYSAGKGPKIPIKDTKKLFIYFAGKKFKIMESIDGELSITKTSDADEDRDQINIQPITMNLIIIS